MTLIVLHPCAGWTLCVFCRSSKPDTCTQFIRHGVNNVSVDEGRTQQVAEFEEELAVGGTESLGLNELLPHTGVVYQFVEQRLGALPYALIHEATYGTARRIEGFHHLIVCYVFPRHRPHHPAEISNLPQSVKPAGRIISEVYCGAEVQSMLSRAGTNDNPVDVDKLQPVWYKQIESTGRWRTAFPA